MTWAWAPMVPARQQQGQVATRARTPPPRARVPRPTDGAAVDSGGGAGAAVADEGAGSTTVRGINNATEGQPLSVCGRDSRQVRRWKLCGGCG